MILEILTPTVFAVVIVLLLVWIFFLRKQYITYYNRYQVSASNEKKFLAEITRRRSLLQVQTVKIDKLQADNNILTSSFTEEKLAHNSLKVESAKKLSKIEQEQSSLTREHEHYKEENQVLTAQIKELSQDSKQITERNKQQLKKLKEDKLKLTKEADTVINKLKKELVFKEKSLKSLRIAKQETLSILSTDKEKIDKIQRKLAHYQHFYNVVAGQKTMLAERNNNWEQALYKLSLEVLKNKATEPVEAYLELSLGELVAKAFELAELGHLVKDEYSVNGVEAPVMMPLA